MRNEIREVSDEEIASALARSLELQAEMVEILRVLEPTAQDFAMRLE